MLDDFFCSEQQINNKLSQNFLIFFIFFMIYINKIFENIKKNFEAHIFFFVNDIEIIISKNLIKQIYDKFQKAVKTAEK